MTTETDIIWRRVEALERENASLRRRVTALEAERWPRLVSEQIPVMPRPAPDYVPTVWGPVERSES